MNFKIKNNIKWVGKIDWELRKFHGDEYTTHKGSTYNSYLIQEEKTALVDTVWLPHSKEYVQNLKNTIDLQAIDYVIANHAEIDHSGALVELLREIPQTPVYCTEKGVQSLKGHFHQDWNFHIVKTGDKLPLGNGKELIFIEAPMLHWPDSMMCYLTGDNVLFSNDAFGQHYASQAMFNDLVDQTELFDECIKYYANILTPFSSLVKAKIEQVLSFKLPVDMICPSHGVIWREKPLQIVEKYMQWASNYNENKITIIYDTMWNGTRKIAETIAESIHEVDKNIALTVYNLSKSDLNDVLTEVFRSKGIIVGSPTINKGVLHSIGGFLDAMKGLDFQGKKAASFGCYGWSGEAIVEMNDRLKRSGFSVVNNGLNTLWNPDVAAVDQAVKFGKTIYSQMILGNAPVRRLEVIGGQRMSWKCQPCGFVYSKGLGDPTQKIAPDTSFEDLPDSWTCPQCGAPKSSFHQVPSW